MIHIAVANGDIDMIKLLAAHGADVASENPMGLYVATPLHLAVLLSDPGVVETLLDLDVPLEEIDRSYLTPLEVAEMIATEDANTAAFLERMISIGEMLVNAGAEVPYTEAECSALSDNPWDQRNAQFRRTMIPAVQQRE